MTTICVLKETAAHETRVAASPETVKKICAMSCKVAVQSGAGLSASITDEAYSAAGATIKKSAKEALEGAHIVLKVAAPEPDLVALFPRDSMLVAMLAPHENKDLLATLAEGGVTALSLELIPRITRAQAMDVLSSQSNLAGYKAVLEAANVYGSAFPMMMTAAGTVPPARVFVMGAGVAGLQAIATARRLGAIVSATDVRPAAKEQVESLGASFIAVQDEEFKQAETAGGYAKEMSAEYKAKQQALVEDHIQKQNIVITTALIPGRTAPRLVTEPMIRSMKTGSVIVDLAVESGGNCALSKPGEIVETGGVKIIGYRNMPGRLAADASALFAKNILSLLGLIIDKSSGTFKLNLEDEILKAITLTHGGQIIHPLFASSEPKAPKATKTKKPSATDPESA